MIRNRFFFSLHSLGLALYRDLSLMRGDDRRSFLHLKEKRARARIWRNLAQTKGKIISYSVLKRDIYFFRLR